MTTLLFTHPACRAHEPGESHPERPERLAAVLEALSEPAFDELIRREAPLADASQLARVHDADYVAATLAAIPASGRIFLDADTTVSPGSREAALRAAGAAIAAVEAVAAGESDNAFCAVRPPGHHAEPHRAMGFCLFNNVAIGALHARAVHGFERVAVVDFDVHHGNGTQALCETDADFFYASTHQSPLYPGTGAAEERGLGNVVNRPLPPGAGSTEFRAALTEHIVPALTAFAPDFLFISAGFDAHDDDPLANLRLHDEDYGWATAELRVLARSRCGGRLVSTLEGGYDLAALGRSAAAHVAALMAD